MDFELQGKPHSKGSAGSSGSHVINIHDEPRHTRFLSLSNSVDYSSYYKLRPREALWRGKQGFILMLAYLCKLHTSKARRRQSLIHMNPTYIDRVHEGANYYAILSVQLVLLITHIRAGVIHFCPNVYRRPRTLARTLYPVCRNKSMIMASPGRTQSLQIQRSGSCSSSLTLA